MTEETQDAAPERNEIITRASSAPDLSRFAQGTTTLGGLTFENAFQIAEAAKMMAAAGLGIAIHAKPVVRAQAAASIEHHDLDGVLCLLQASRAATLRWTR